MNNDVNDINWYIKKMKKKPSEYQWLDEELKANKEITLAAVKKDGSMFSYAPAEHYLDYELVLAAVKSYPENYKDLSEELRCNPSIIDAAMECGGLLEYVPRSVATKSIIKKALSNDGMAIKFFPEFFDNKELMLLAVSNNGFALKFCGEKLRKDREIVMAAVSNDGVMINYADDIFKDDEEVVRTAVNQNGLALGFTTRKFQKQRDICLMAVTNNSDAIEDVCPDLRNDEEIMKAAINGNCSNIKFVRYESPLYKSESFAKFLLNLLPSYIEYFSKEIKGNRQIALIVLSKNGNMFGHISYQLQSDEELIVIAIKTSPEVIRMFSLEMFNNDLLDKIKDDEKVLDFLSKHNSTLYNSVFERILALNRQDALINKIEETESVSANKIKKKI